MYSLNKWVSLPRAAALLLAFLLPALAFANSWTLPTNPTTGAGYSLRWYGSVPAANTVVMMAVLAPGSSIWATCGSGYPDSNLQATVTGGRNFEVNGLWSLRITQQIGSNLITVASTTLQVGPAQVDLTPPSLPTNASASAITASGFTLSWTASTDDIGVVRYDIYSSGSKIATASSTSATIAGLAASTTYSITVEAFDASGKASGQSSPALSVTTASQTLGWTLPTNPTVGNTGLVKWVGDSTSSTVLMWCQAPGSNTWFNCGGGGGNTNPRTINGGWSFNTYGPWVFQVRDGTTSSSPVLAQTIVYVH